MDRWSQRPNSLSLFLLGGVAFGLMDLASKLHESTADRTALLEYASQLVNANLKYLDHPDFKRDKQMQVGFLLGTPGVQVLSPYSIWLLLKNSCQMLTSNVGSHISVPRQIMQLSLSYNFRRKVRKSVRKLSAK